MYMYIVTVFLFECSEPLVTGGIRRGDEYDGQDGQGVIQVRPMSRNLKHRQSRIMETDPFESEDDSRGSL